MHMARKFVFEALDTQYLTIFIKNIIENSNVKMVNAKNSGKDRKTPGSRFKLIFKNGRRFLQELSVPCLYLRPFLGLPASAAVVRPAVIGVASNGGL